MKCPSGHDMAMNELTTAMHETKPTRSANIPTGSPNWMQRIKKKKKSKGEDPKWGCIGKYLRGLGGGSWGALINMHTVYVYEIVKE